MIVRFSDLLSERRAARAAAAAFTCYGLETATGVLLAAEERGVPVVLVVSGAALRSPIGLPLVASLRACAERSSIPAVVQLDHVDDLGLVSLAFDAGVGCVMADGSRLSDADNAAFVGEAAAIAERYGGEVEAELGLIEGDDERANSMDASGLTDPLLAGPFLAQTRAACLAVSIGNVHGRYRYPPTLDWERLEQIRRSVDVPLSLHGASGLPHEDLRRAVSGGIAKVNVNTELRDAYIAALSAHLHEANRGAAVLELGVRIVEAIYALAGTKIDALAGADASG